jgi:hypothetical protein
LLQFGAQSRFVSFGLGGLQLRLLSLRFGGLLGGVGLDLRLPGLLSLFISPGRGLSVGLSLGFCLGSLSLGRGGILPGLRLFLREF